MDVEKEMKAFLGEKFCVLCDKLTFLKCWKCSANYCSPGCMLKDQHKHFIDFGNAKKTPEDKEAGNILQNDRIEDRIRSVLQKITTIVDRHKNKTTNAFADNKSITNNAGGSNSAGTTINSAILKMKEAKEMLRQSYINSDNDTHREELQKRMLELDRKIELHYFDEYLSEIQD